jgi:hypothetical protein
MSLGDTMVRVMKQSAGEVWIGAAKDRRAGSD